MEETAKREGWGKTDVCRIPRTYVRGDGGGERAGEGRGESENSNPFWADLPSGWYGER